MVETFIGRDVVEQSNQNLVADNHEFHQVRNENISGRNKIFGLSNDFLDTGFQLVDTGEKTLSNQTDSKPEAPDNAQYDNHGNLTKYTIGPKDAISNVQVEYSRSNDASPTVSKLEITRPNNGDHIVYERQPSEPSDSNSQSVYLETRNGVKGDLQFANCKANEDGRINIYFNLEATKLAITYDPKTGKEGYR